MRGMVRECVGVRGVCGLVEVLFNGKDQQKSTFSTETNWTKSSLYI